LQFVSTALHAEQALVAPFRVDWWVLLNQDKLVGGALMVDSLPCVSSTVLEQSTIGFLAPDPLF
jgi:hypothetical protein